jgi:hypothetical protein
VLILVSIICIVCAGNVYDYPVIICTSAEAPLVTVPVPATLPDGAVSTIVRSDIQNVPLMEVTVNVTLYLPGNPSGS